MGARKLFVYPAFYRRVRHYRDRIALKDGRPQVASRFVQAIHDLIMVDNPQRGHLAGFEAPDLADILRAPVPGFTVFAAFYRWDGRQLIVRLNPALLK